MKPSTGIASVVGFSLIVAAMGSPSKPTTTPAPSIPVTSHATAPGWSGNEPTPKPYHAPLSYQEKRKPCDALPTKDFQSFNCIMRLVRTDAVFREDLRRELLAIVDDLTPEEREIAQQKIDDLLRP